MQVRIVRHTAVSAYGIYRVLSSRLDWNVSTGITQDGMLMKHDCGVSGKACIYNIPPRQTIPPIAVRHATLYTSRASHSKALDGPDRQTARSRQLTGNAPGAPSPCSDVKSQQWLFAVFRLGGRGRGSENAGQRGPFSRFRTKFLHLREAIGSPEGNADSIFPVFQLIFHVSPEKRQCAGTETSREHAVGLSRVCALQPPNRPTAQPPTARRH